MERRELQGLTRDELVARAERLGVQRPRVLTQPELMDEILSRTAKTDRDRARARGWLGRARDLIAGVVERGLHLPEVARALRATPSEADWPAPPPPLPTITLAEIYAAQGHLERAIGVLDEVLAREPDHAEARTLRDRFTEQAKRPKTKTSRPPPAASTSIVPEAAPSGPVDTEAITPRAAVVEAEAPPLPERYDVDEVVAIAVEPTTVYLYWEVRPTTLARARARRPDGALTVRVASVSPSWDGPITDTRDLRVDPLFGDLFVHDLQPGADVRVSVGWLAAAAAGTNGSAPQADFEPFAVGVEISAPRAIPREHVARTVARWSPQGAAGPQVLEASAQVVGALSGADATLSRIMRVVGGQAGGPGVGGGTPHPGWDPDASREMSGWTATGRGWSEAASGPRAGYGGASELGRESRGGASDLSRGGASDLARRR